MIFSKYIPRSIRNNIRLMRLKKRYPKVSIESYLVGEKVKLGKYVGVSRNCDIRENVEIGDYSFVNQGTIIASGLVGKFTSIGYNCQIGMFEHPTNYMSTSPRTYDGRNIFGVDEYWNDIFSPPIIGNDVWVGSNVVILQGVKIGDGAIIAAGAVVTKDVEPFSIVGGVPAKIIKKRFDDKHIEFLEELKWWNLPIEELSKYKHYFESKEKWIDLIE